MKSKKIAIIGHFGGNENILDGQTIKTKILYDELRQATDWQIRKVDTYYKSKKPIMLLINSIVTLISTRDIIVLLSGNGMKFYFPLLSYFSRFRTRIYHDVIGGNLDSYVKKYPKFQKYLNSFEVNWVETENLRKKLEYCGVNNCEVIPNFKRLNIATIENNEYSEPFKFCTFSRVMREKGVEIAIDAVQAINTEAGREVCKLDIYGRVDDAYKDDFERIMENVTSSIQYKGMVPYDKSVEAIKGYYALLFPTFWMGEGFPGTIVDAFSAGLPVIATDWNCNGEIVINGVNGILYPNNNHRDLKDAMKWLIYSKNEYVKMKKKCIITAKKYQSDEYIRGIVSTITKKK